MKTQPAGRKYRLSGGRLVSLPTLPVNEKTELVPNRPTPEGRELGRELARFADAAEPKMLALFPSHRLRCKSCAFRGGTVPNGCPTTLMDALKCVVEGVAFYCHETLDGSQPTQLCAGWALLTQSKTGKAPWPFADESEG